MKLIWKLFFLFFFFYPLNSFAYITYAGNLFDTLHIDQKGLIPQEIVAKYREKNIQNDESINQYEFHEKNNLLDALYLKANTAYDIENNDPAYDIRLELDFFDQGYYQQKQQDKREFLNKQIVFFRSVKSIEILKKEEQLRKIQSYKDTLHVMDLFLKMKFYELSFHNAQKRFEYGYISKYDLDMYKVRIQEIKDNLFYLKHKKLLKIPVNIWNLLNKIEEISLVSTEQLIHLLKIKSSDPKLIQALNEKEMFHDSWRDRIRLNLYAGKRKMYLAQEQTLVGIEAKIPLSGYKEDNKYEKVTVKNLNEQLQLQKQKDIATLKNAVDSFLYKQQRIKTLFRELNIIQKQINQWEYIAQTPYGSMAEKDFLKQEKIVLQYLQKYIALRQERINAYEELMIIVHSIHENSLEKVIQNKYGK